MELLHVAGFEQSLIAAEAFVGGRLREGAAEDELVVAVGAEVVAAADGAFEELAAGDGTDVVATAEGELAAVAAANGAAANGVAASGAAACGTAAVGVETATGEGESLAITASRPTESINKDTAPASEGQATSWLSPCPDKLPSELSAASSVRTLSCARKVLFAGL